MKKKDSDAKTGGIKSYILIGLCLLILFILLKCAAYAVPNAPVQRNIERSIPQLVSEGTYPRVFYSTDTFFYSQQLDNNTDAIHLNIAYNMRNHSLFQSVFGDYRNVSNETEIESLIEATQGENTLSPYARHWVGSMAYLRILFAFFSLGEIRILLQFASFFLLFAGCFSLYKHCGGKAALAYFIGIMCINPIIASTSINTFGAFFVALICPILIPLVYPNKATAGICLFVIGGLTAYLDMLISPLLTFGIGAMVILCIDKKNLNSISYTNTKPLVFYTFSKLVSIVGGWIAGYAILWLPKWVLASVTLKQNIIWDAIQEALHFSGGHFPSWGPQNTVGMIIESIKLNFLTLFPINIIKAASGALGSVGSIILWAVILVVLILPLILCRKEIKQQEIGLLISVVIIAMAPYAWYIVVHTHSFVHFWMTFRSQAGTVFAVTFTYFSLIDFNIFKDRRSHKKEISVH